MTCGCSMPPKTGGSPTLSGRVSGTGLTCSPSRSGVTSSTDTARRSESRASKGGRVWHLSEGEVSGEQRRLRKLACWDVWVHMVLLIVRGTKGEGMETRLHCGDKEVESVPDCFWDSDWDDKVAENHKEDNEGPEEEGATPSMEDEEVVKPRAAAQPSLPTSEERRVGVNIVSVERQTAELTGGTRGRISRGVVTRASTCRWCPWTTCTLSTHKAGKRRTTWRKRQ